MKPITIAAIAFWVLFVGSFGLYKYYPGVDTAWVVVSRLIILALAVFALIKTYRDRTTTGKFSYQGLPRWLERFLMDEEDPPQK